MSWTRQNPFKPKPLILSLIKVLAVGLGIQSDSSTYNFRLFKEIWRCLVHGTIWRLNCCFYCFVFTIDWFEFLGPLTQLGALFFIIRQSLCFQVTDWSVEGCFFVILWVWFIVVVVTFTWRFDCLEQISFIWPSCLLLPNSCEVLLVSGCNLIKSTPVFIPKWLDSRGVAYAKISLLNFLQCNPLQFWLA